MVKHRAPSGGSSLFIVFSYGISCALIAAKAERRVLSFAQTFPSSHLRKINKKIMF